MFANPPLLESAEVRGRICTGIDADLLARCGFFLNMRR